MTLRYLAFFITLFMVSTLTFGQSENPKVPGTIIKHSNPESKIYLGSPSIVILPSGNYIATHDYFGSGTNGEVNKTAVYRSKDKGKTWKFVIELKDSYWSNLFVNNGALYLMGTSREYGNLVIRKSEDDGKTWSAPSDGSNGLLRDDFQYHTAPMPVVFKEGRVYRAVEVRSPAYGWGINFEALVVSAPVDANLLESKNWTVSNRIHFDQNWQGGAWLEGNIVETPDGDLVNILRVDNKEYGGKAAWLPYDVKKNQLYFSPEKGFINFPGGSKKFTIRYDPKSKRYWTLSNFIKDFGYFPGSTRNCLALSSSPDLLNWTVHEEVLYNPDVHKHGFQYADWQMDGTDIITIVRTAYDDDFGGAHNNHDANFMTFHRIVDFRNRIDKNIATFHNDK